MSNPPPYNPYYDQQQPPPSGWNSGAQAPTTGYQPPPYGYGPPPPKNDYDNQGGAPPQQPPMFPPPVHGFAAHQAMGQERDFEANLIKPASLAFDNKSVRAGFIRKVFTLISIMLLIVVAMIALFLFEPHCFQFVRDNHWAYYVSYAVFIISYFCIICCESVRRNFPGNLICLFVLTVSMGYMTAMISSFYGTEIVFIAMAICALCSFSIILFACQTKYDFTSWMGVMFVICIVLFFFGIAAILCKVVFHSDVLYAVYAAIAALVFMIFLAIDTQMVVGGKRYEYTPEEYIMAAVQLFLDIIYIFIYLMQIIGIASRN